MLEYKSPLSALKVFGGVVQSDYSDSSLSEKESRETERAWQNIRRYTEVFDGFQIGILTGKN